MVEGALLFGGLLVLSVSIFGGVATTSQVISLPYLVMPIIIWAAFRFTR